MLVTDSNAGLLVLVSGVVFRYANKPNTSQLFALGVCVCGCMTRNYLDLVLTG